MCDAILLATPSDSTCDLQRYTLVDCRLKNSTEMDLNKILERQKL